MTAAIANCFFTAASETVKMPYKILNELDRIKLDPNAIGMLLSFVSNGMELFQKSRHVISFNPAIRAFGSVGALYNAFQIGGTINYVMARTYASYEGKGFFNKDNSKIDCLIAVSFGVANLASSLLWANEHKLIDLSKYAIKSIGGIAIGSVSLAGAITVGAIGGFAGFTIGAVNKLTEERLTPLSRDEKISNVCKIAWSVTEIALMVIPAVGIAPAAPLLIAGSMFAKAAGIASFIYSNN